MDSMVAPRRECWCSIIPVNSTKNRFGPIQSKPMQAARNGQAHQTRRLGGAVKVNRPITPTMSATRCGRRGRRSFSMAVQEMSNDSLAPSKPRCRVSVVHGAHAEKNARTQQIPAAMINPNVIACPVSVGRSVGWFVSFMQRGRSIYESSEAQIDRRLQRPRGHRGRR